MHGAPALSLSPSTKSLLDLTSRKSDDLQKRRIPKQMLLQLIHTGNPHQLLHLVSQNHQHRRDHHPLHSLRTKIDPSKETQTKKENEKMIQKAPACPHYRLGSLPPLQLPVDLPLCPLIKLPPTFLHLPPSSASPLSSIRDQ